MHVFMKPLVLIAALLLQAAAFAHEVIVQIESGPPRQVRLTYSDGEPFSHELYEFFAEDGKTALHSGRTDAEGVAVIPDPKAVIPDSIRDPRPAQQPHQLQPQRLRLRAFSADGHGVDTLLNLPAGTAAVQAEPSVAQPPAFVFLQDRSRLLRALLGTALIAAGAAIYVALQRRKKALKRR